MALIICSECGKEFSDKAVACPNCGCPTEETIKQPIPEAVVPVSTVGLTKAAPSEKTKILRDYLEKVRLLETDVYTYDTIIENLSGKKIQLSSKPELRAEPVKPTPVKEPDKLKISSKKVWDIGRLCLIASGLFFVLSMFLSLGNWIGFLPGDYDLIKHYEYLFLYLSIFCLPAGIVLLVGSPFVEKMEESYNKKLRSYQIYCSNLASYERLCSEYNNTLLEIEKYEQRKPKEIAFNKALDEEIANISKNQVDTETALKKMYEQNIVHPKYWGIVPISMFCEYIDTERRTVLSGENGMYDLYEAELLGKQIVGELQVVNNNLRAINATLQNMSQKLSGIQRNQMLLYGAVMEGNTIAQNISREIGQQSRQLDKLSDSVEDNLQLLRQSAELTAYNTAATARRTDALAKIAEYEFSLRHPSFPSV